MSPVLRDIIDRVGGHENVEGDFPTSRLSTEAQKQSRKPF